MPDLPLVTVVTPSLNQAEFLPHTIESVLSQDYPGIEYIVMDGGSTDGSVEVIERYADRLASWCSQRDGGQADAVNRGWERSRGSILAFLNSDDVYLPGAVSAIVAAFRDHPEAGLVHGQGQLITRHGRVLQTTRVCAEPAQGMLEALTCLPQPATFVRRAVLDRIGMLDPTLHFGLDMDFHLRAVGNFPAVSLSRAIACLRLHPRAKTVALGLRAAPEVLRIAGKIVAHPANYPRFAVDEAVVWSRAHQFAAQFLYMHGEPRQAWLNLKRAIDIAPSRRGAILRRDIPRMALRTLLSADACLRLSSLYRRLQRHRFGRRTAADTTLGG